METCLLQKKIVETTYFSTKYLIQQFKTNLSSHVNTNSFSCDNWMLSTYV